MNDITTLIDMPEKELMYKKTGVLSVIDNKPYYIIELIKEGDLSYVIVYNADPNSTLESPRKKVKEVAEPMYRFSNNTLLGQLANKYFPMKKSTKFVPDEPIFTAPVVPNQTNTFTGKTESGFFDREEDKWTVTGGEKKLVRGRNTGVFIGLSSITWEDKVHIPTESLVKALRQYQADSNFFDLTGNNNSASNPLSTYYKGGNI